MDKLVDCTISRSQAAREVRQITRRKAEQRLLNIADEDTSLFPTLVSNKETNDKLARPRKYMQSLLEAHNRPHADLHSFRHTFNQSLSELEMKIEDRQKLLAHASTTTAKIYTNPNLEVAKELINKIKYLGKNFKPVEYLLYYIKIVSKFYNVWFI